MAKKVKKRVGETEREREGDIGFQKAVLPNSQQDLCFSSKIMTGVAQQTPYYSSVLYI
jgi:hypothetical protein